MTLFNGLLCLSAEQIGCDAVKNSQGDDGRWWRSPRRIGWEYPDCGASSPPNEAPPNKPPPNQKCDVSFSPDQALGVLSYSLASRDASRFSSWLKWITDHRGKLTATQIKEVAKDEIAKLNWPQWQVDAAAALIANLLPARLTYCTDDFDARCTLRPGDCAIIKQMGGALGNEKDICGDYLLFDQIEGIFKSAGISMPNALAAAGSYFNDENYPLHLAAVQVFIRQRMGQGNDPLILAARSKLASREPLNPFYAYLNSNGSGALALLLNECPAPNSAPTTRTEWAWERPDAQKAWLHSMYWDCIFVRNLLR
jgi:hypothetical protein